MLRLWAIVFATNVLGAFRFALLAVERGSAPHGWSSSSPPSDGRVNGKLELVLLEWVVAGWLAAVPLGNITGGVVIVGLLNYGQVRAGDD